MSLAPVYKRFEMQSGNVIVFGAALALNGYASYSKGHGVYLQIYLGWIHFKLWLWMFNDGADYKDKS